MRYDKKSFLILLLLLIVSLSLLVFSFRDNQSIVKPSYSASLLGDVTGDGEIGINDVSRLYRAHKGLITLTKLEKITGDIIADNEIKINDVSKLYRHVKGVIVSDDIGSNLDSKYFLATARRVWDTIVSGDKYFTYRNGNYIPITTSYCDCSSYVTWVLYEFGYTDFKGEQLYTDDFYKTDFNKKYGWTEIKFQSGSDITSIIRPGDIVVRVPIDSNGTVGYGHVDIVATEGGTYSYDCGDSASVKHGAYPEGIQYVSWYKKGNPGKIIRPTIPK